MEKSGIDAVEIRESGDGDYGVDAHNPCPVTVAACAALLDGRIPTTPPKSPE